MTRSTTKKATMTTTGTTMTARSVIVRSVATTHGYQTIQVSARIASNTTTRQTYHAYQCSATRREGARDGHIGALAIHSEACERDPCAGCAWLGRLTDHSHGGAGVWRVHPADMRQAAGISRTSGIGTH